MANTATSPAAKKRFAMAALLLYLLIAYLYFGISVLGHSGRLVGSGGDAVLSLWCLHWWHYALTHHLNPFISHLVWAPSGYNLAKSASIPGIYLLTLPLHYFTTPLTAYNIIVIFAPGMAAWTLSLLILDLTKQRLPALAAGYLFGFSPYMTAQMVAHANLTTGVFLIPLIVWLVIRCLNANINKWFFIVGLSLCLTLLFLISKEMLATVSLCGIIALFIALLMFPTLTSQHCKQTLLALALAYCVMVMLLTPFLYYFFTDTLNGHYAANPALYANDLLSFIIPTPLMQLATPATATLSSHFSATYVEQGAYLGIPLLIIVIHHCWRHWRHVATRYCLLLALIFAFISLGPTLRIAGTKTLTLHPNHFLFSLPFIGYSLAQRYALYTSFTLAVIVALWLANIRSQLMAWIRYPLLLLAILFLLPCLKSSALHQASRYFYTDTTTIPDFFTHHHYQTWLQPHDTVLILPFSPKVTPSQRGYIVQAGTLYQLSSHFYFTLAGGYLGVIPQAYQHPIVTEALGKQRPAATNFGEFKQFLTAKHIDAIIALPNQQKKWQGLLNQLTNPPVNVGGIYLYRITSP